MGFAVNVGYCSYFELCVLNGSGLLGLGSCLQLPAIVVVLWFVMFVCGVVVGGVCLVWWRCLRLVYLCWFSCLFDCLSCWSLFGSVELIVDMVVMWILLFVLLCFGDLLVYDCVVCFIVYDEVLFVCCCFCCLVLSVCFDCCVFFGWCFATFANSVVNCSNSSLCVCLPLRLFCVWLSNLLLLFVHVVLVYWFDLNASLVICLGVINLVVCLIGLCLFSLVINLVVVFVLLVLVKWWIGAVLGCLFD